MPTSLNKPPSPRHRTKALAKGGTVVAIAVLIAVGFVWLVVGTIYLTSAVSHDLQAEGALVMTDPGG